MRTGRRVRVGSASPLTQRPGRRTFWTLNMPRTPHFSLYRSGSATLLPQTSPCAHRGARHQARHRTPHAARRTGHAPLLQSGALPDRAGVCATSRECLRARRATRHCHVDAHLSRPRTHVFEVPQVRVHCGLQTSSNATRACGPRLQMDDLARICLPRTTRRKSEELWFYATLDLEILRS